jgi:hypothetical protein
MGAKGIIMKISRFCNTLSFSRPPHFCRSGINSFFSSYCEQLSEAVSEIDIFSCSYGSACFLGDKSVRLLHYQLVIGSSSHRRLRPSTLFEIARAVLRS